MTDRRSIAVWPASSKVPSPYQFYVRASDFEPLNVSCEKNWEPQNQAQWSEKLVATLFEVSGWVIAKRRYRIRGSEIDLIVVNPATKEGRLIEVKSRRHKGPLDLSAAESLLPFAKARSIRVGSRRVASTYYNIQYWSFDLTLVTPNHVPGKHLVTTWANAMDLGAKN